jgi:hypothetical protein
VLASFFYIFVIIVYKLGEPIRGVGAYWSRNGGSVPLAVINYVQNWREEHKKNLKTYSKVAGFIRFQVPKAFQHFVIGKIKTHKNKESLVSKRHAEIILD